MDRAIIEMLSDLSKKFSVERSRQMGVDCGINGPNETNCNFRLFATKEHTKAWGEGKREGEANKCLYEGKEWLTEPEPVLHQSKEGCA